MGTVTSTVSPTASQIKYVDAFGVEHLMKASETFALTIDDNSSTDVRYRWAPGATAFLLQDGRRLEFRAGAEIGQVGSNSNVARYVGPITDAQQGTVLYNIPGEFIIECPESHLRQHWRVTKINTSDADFGSAGTLVVTMEDQRGNVMNWPFQLISSLAVGQAS
jgi:hypothetical protein